MANFVWKFWNEWLKSHSDIFIFAWKIKIFWKFLPRKSNYFGEIIWKKSNFFKNLPGKIKIVFIRIHDPQISNQIDAAVSYRPLFRHCSVLYKYTWRGQGVPLLRERSYNPRVELQTPTDYGNNLENRLLAGSRAASGACLACNQICGQLKQYLKWGNFTEQRWDPA